MNAVHGGRLRAVGVCVLSVATVLSTGCGRKAPAEANAALDAALKALAQGDAKTFVETVLPAQQPKVTTLAESPFFQAAKSHKIDNEFDLNVTDDSASILVKLYFDDAQEVFSSLFFIMKKADDAWRIDLDATIKNERDVDGAHAFKAMTFKKR